ncbi:MAG: hypothetical protein K8R99_08870 [Actinomycetia bacterium]|nr:hypothetical protein [Actinomycetes bacterium]
MLKRTLTALGVLMLVGCSADSTASTATTDKATTSTATTATTIASEPAVDWSADLDALDAGVRRIHPNPFWRVSEEEWDARIASAREVLPTLGRHQAEMVLFELTALLDGHSGIYPSEIGYHFYALRLYHFTDGYFLLDGPDPTAIGGELVAINGVPVDDVAALLTPLIAHDSEKTFEVVLPMYMMISEILEGTGIVTDPTSPAFDILRADGTHAILNPETLLWDPYVAEFDGLPVGLPQAPEPLSQSRRNEPFWWTMVDDVLYFQYNNVVSGEGDNTMEALVAEVRERLAVGGVRRVVVDIRHNNGGDRRWYVPLKQLLLDPLVDHPGGLYIIIGRQTFSAGVLFATELDVQSVSAVFVGEPTAGSPNLYADVRPVELPSSGIRVNVSSSYYDFASPDDPRTAIEPDIPVELSSADYFAGFDPVLQAAIDA